MRISKREVDAAGPGRHYDETLAGFGLYVGKGGGKSYFYEYRPGRGRGVAKRRMTIGKHGVMTPEKARKEAVRLAGIVADGGDPAGERQAALEAPTVADAVQRFLAEHAEAKRKPSTAREYRRLLEAHVLPALGKRPVPDVTRAEIARLHHAGRAAPYQANRVLATCSKLFSLCELWGWRPDGSNPCRRIERYREAKREAMLSADELARLGAALEAAQCSPFAVAAIRLLLFTGARLGEVLGLQWAQVDFERGEARLADSKTGAKTVQLAAPALAVLASIPRLEGNPYVIPGQRRGAAMVNIEKPWRGIREAAGLPALRLHDLRHAFASVGACSGMGLPILGRLLGHTQPATTARYAHVQSDPAKAAAAAIAGRIAAGLAGGSGAEVVPLPASGRKA